MKSTLRLLTIFVSHNLVISFSVIFRIRVRFFMPFIILLPSRLSFASKRIQLDSLYQKLFEIVSLVLYFHLLSQTEFFHLDSHNSHNFFLPYKSFSPATPYPNISVETTFLGQF